MRAKYHANTHEHNTMRCDAMEKTRKATRIVKIDLKLRVARFRHFNGNIKCVCSIRTMFAVFNEPYEKFIKFKSNNRKMYELLALLHYINMKKGGAS